MRRLFIMGMSMLYAFAMQAQEQIRVWKEGESKRFRTSELVFSEDGSSFQVNDSTYDCAQIDSITVVHTVTVTFDGDTAYVDLGHAPNVTDTIQGAHVKLISTDTKNELEFVLQGESTHGSLYYDGPLKCRFYLNGLNLTSDQGAAIDIKCGKRVDLILNEGTENFLADAAGGDQKAALYCKGHLEVSGGGALTVSGNAKHGIATKEYMQIKKSTGSITVNKAVSDAMHIGQYFLMNGGTVTLSKQKGDGLQVEILTDVTESGDTIPDPDKEDNGQVFIRGGLLTITAEEDLTRGIKAPLDMTVSGGTVRVEAKGDGSKGISVTRNMLINQDTDNTLIQVKATGDTYEYDDDEEEYNVGIRIKGDLTINAGTVQVDAGKYSYGIRLSKNSIYTKSDEAVVNAKFSRASK